jgi:hypothetical protein
LDSRIGELVKDLTDLGYDRFQLRSILQEAADDARELEEILEDYLRFARKCRGGLTEPLTVYGLPRSIIGRRKPFRGIALRPKGLVIQSAGSKGSSRCQNQ